MGDANRIEERLRGRRAHWTSEHGLRGCGTEPSDGQHGHPRQYRSNWVLRKMIDQGMAEWKRKAVLPERQIQRTTKPEEECGDAELLVQD